jgi:quinol monooxygenase YgiN
LVRIDAADGKDAGLEALLIEARSVVLAETGTTTWFAVRFGSGEYGIFDAFEDDAGRDIHLNGEVPAALREHADLLDGHPEIERVDVLAEKLDFGPVRKGLLLRLPIKPEHAEEAAEFLRSGRQIVDDEPGTTAWFALRFDNGDDGVLDVFPDTKARRAHLLGGIPRKLAAHGLPWLGGLPQLSFADVLAQKLGPDTS